VPNGTSGVTRWRFWHTVLATSFGDFSLIFNGFGHFRPAALVVLEEGDNLYLTKRFYGKSFRH
jgi:hypothetical protein